MAAASYADVLKKTGPLKVDPTSQTAFNTFNAYLENPQSTYDVSQVNQGLNAIGAFLGHRSVTFYDSAKIQIEHALKKNEELPEAEKEPQLAIVKRTISAALDNFIFHTEPLPIRLKTYRAIETANNLGPTHPQRQTVQSIKKACQAIFQAQAPLRCARELEAYLNKNLADFDPELVKQGLVGLGMIANLGGQDFSDKVRISYEKDHPYGYKSVRIAKAVSTVLWSALDTIACKNTKHALVIFLLRNSGVIEGRELSSIQKHQIVIQYLDKPAKERPLIKNWNETCQTFGHKTTQLFFNNTLPAELDEMIYNRMSLADCTALARASYPDDLPLVQRINGRMGVLSKKYTDPIFIGSRLTTYRDHAGSLVQGTGYEIQMPEIYLIPHLQRLKELFLPNSDAHLANLLTVLQLMETQYSGFKMPNIQKLVFQIQDPESVFWRVSTENLLALLRYFPCLKSIRVDNCTRLDVRIFDPKYFPELKDLNLSHNASMSLRPDGRTHTYNLNRNLGWISRKVTKITLKNIKGVQWKSLISIANGNHVTDMTLDDVSNISRRPKRMHWSTQTINPNTALRTLRIFNRYVFTSDLNAFAQRMTNLRAIDLSGSSILFDSHLPVPQLRTLTIENPASGIYHLVPHIFTIFPGLEELNLETDATQRFESLPLETMQANTTLKRLNLLGHRLKLNNIAGILRTFTGLQTLKLNSNEGLIPDDMDIRGALTINGSLVVSDSLEELNLHECHIRLTGARLATLLSSMPNLKKLTLSYNTNLLGNLDELRSHLPEGRFQSLTHLNIDGFSIDDEGFLNLMKCFPNLEKLSAVGCQVTGNSLARLVNHKSVTETTEEGQTIQVSKPERGKTQFINIKLRELNLQGSKVTYKGLHYILLLYPQIRTVNAKKPALESLPQAERANATPPLTASELSHLKSKFPWIKITS